MNQAEASLPGFLSADDGLDPCFGMTAGLDGGFSVGAVFTAGSFWWDDAKAVGDDLEGSIGTEAGEITVSTPTIEYLTVPVDLGLGERIALPPGTKDHWETPECSSAKGGGA